MICPKDHMTDLIERLRDGADRIHSIGPDRAAGLLREAAEHLSAARTYRANMEDPPTGLEPHEVVAPLTKREKVAIKLVATRPEGEPLPTYDALTRRADEAIAAEQTSEPPCT